MRVPTRCRPPRWRSLALPTAAGLLRMLEGVALHLVRIDRRERGVILLARPDPDHPLDRLHEDLPVAHLAGPRGRQDRLDRRVHKGLRAHHLDLRLLMELHHDRGPAILPDHFLLAAVAAHAAHGDPGDPGPEQRLLDLRQALGTYDRGDELHVLDLGMGVWSRTAAEANARLRDRQSRLLS